MFNPAQIVTFKNEIDHYFDNRYTFDLTGEAWEAIYATVKDADWSPKRDNKPYADIEYRGLNIACKTTKHDRPSFIITRSLRVDYSIKDIHARSSDKLGDVVADCFNSFILNYEWDRYAILLRRNDNTEFLCWETDVEPLNKDGLIWRDTGRAIGNNRNIAGYDRYTGEKLCAWNSGGKQFYQSFSIPEDATRITLN
jgi:hypothetical protein